MILASAVNVTKPLASNEVNITNPHAVLQFSLSKPCSSVQWMKDGKPFTINNGIKHEQSRDGKSHKLVIPNASQEDIGYYTAVLPDGTSTSTQLTMASKST